uniref:Putative ovule protein n=1 Tax=Solanum chacoense TaxID=4108 RepID=A0A0V0GM51_SOLCH
MKVTCKSILLLFSKKFILKIIFFKIFDQPNLNAPQHRFGSDCSSYSNESLITHANIALKKN